VERETSAKGQTRCEDPRDALDHRGHLQPDVESDIALFRGRTLQYVFISSATVYEKPPQCPVITESTPLGNPFWQYARDKIACGLRLNQAFREEAFPATIVRLEPSLEGTLLGDKTHSALFDNSKIKSFVPGYGAAVPFRESIRRTLAWFKASPQRMKSSGETDGMLDRLIETFGHVESPTAGRRTPPYPACWSSAAPVNWLL
jgi:hypothetical protein